MENAKNNDMVKKEINIKINGNLLTVTNGESLRNLLSRVTKLEKVNSVSINNNEINVQSNSYILKEDDEIYITQKTAKDFAQEKIGLRTSAIYFSRKTGNKIKEKYRSMSKDQVCSVQTENGNSVKFIVNNAVLEFRSGFATKEPDTIKWLKKLSHDDVLLDIGANIGAVSLFAAVGQKCKVISVEPNHRNYNILTEHISINNQESNIFSINAAITEVTQMNSFFIKNTSVGASGNSFGKAIDELGNEYQEQISQACLGISVDDLVAMKGMWTPNYLKIDVDGFEDLVILGAKESLKKGLFKSISVEIDIFRPKAKEVIVGMFNDMDYHIQYINGENVDSSSKLPGKFGHCFNYIFEKN